MQEKKRFPDGAVLAEWGKGTGDDVWILNKLEELAAKIGCVPKTDGNDSMVCCYETLCSTILLETPMCYQQLQMLPEGHCFLNCS
jgi:hypothetical protein